MLTRVNKYDKSGMDLYKGNTAEKNFTDILSGHGYIVSDSTINENKFAHIDKKITKDGKTYTVDVKSLKHRFKAHGWILAEFVGKYNSPGWMYGKSDLISFELNQDEILLVSRLEFVKLVESLVKDEYVKFVEQTLYKKCRRDQGDVYGHITYDDLKTIKTMIIKRK